MKVEKSLIWERNDRTSHEKNWIVTMDGGILYLYHYYDKSIGPLIICRTYQSKKQSYNLQNQETKPIPIARNVLLNTWRTGTIMKKFQTEFVKAVSY